MAADSREIGALVVAKYKEAAFYEAKWRDATGAQRKRRLGRAWLEQDPQGNWVRRQGRLRSGYLDERRAYLAMARIIEEHEDELRRTSPEQREASFDEAATAWLAYVEYEKRIKPSTLVRYRSLLRPPGDH